MYWRSRLWYNNVWMNSCSSYGHYHNPLSLLVSILHLCRICLIFVFDFQLYFWLFDFIFFLMCLCFLCICVALEFFWTAVFGNWKKFYLAERTWYTVKCDWEGLLVGLWSRFALPHVMRSESISALQAGSLGRRSFCPTVCILMVRSIIEAKHYRMV